MVSKAVTWAALFSIVRQSIAQQTRTQNYSKLQPTRPATTIRHHQSPDSRGFATTPFRCRQDDAPQPKDSARATKRKAGRTQASKTSLKRIALQAESSRTIIKGSGTRRHVDPNIETRDVTAYCAAETYNIHVARHLLRQEGYEPDPFTTGLYPQVLHVQTPKSVTKDDATGERKVQGAGDVFVFPSGSVVTWNVPEQLAHKLLQRLLPKAAEGGHLDKLEAEDLEYVEDPTEDSSKIVGDTIILGTAKSGSVQEDGGGMSAEDRQNREADTVLAKIAFSSALARSTKLAVLENLLSNYFASTRSIPTTLSLGKRLNLKRSFVLKKTGELLSIRAQLNLYSELTDSLPDMFWDSRHELQLENYYEQVGRALDVGVRIRTLNERINYASEIAAVLRERLSEKHSTELEWLIIILISVEVIFEFVRYWRESSERRNPGSTEVLWHEWLENELGRR